ncbi:hypothetical protein B0H19DRAFT_1256436 [Mycena capillaripes]|nr:hypothetical protein B0H19DRAFT_1256436 [Mycena capillaripes]
MPAHAAPRLGPLAPASLAPALPLPNFRVASSSRPLAVCLLVQRPHLRFLSHSRFHQRPSDDAANSLIHTHLSSSISGLGAACARQQRDFWLRTRTCVSPPTPTSSSVPATSLTYVNTTPAPPPGFLGSSLPVRACSALFGSAPAPALPCFLPLPAAAQEPHRALVLPLPHLYPVLWARRCLRALAAHFLVPPPPLHFPARSRFQSGPVIPPIPDATTSTPLPRFMGSPLPARARGALFGPAPAPALPRPLPLPAAAQ